MDSLLLAAEASGPVNFPVLTALVVIPFLLSRPALWVCS